MATFGYFWLLLAIFGYFWLLLATSVYSWLLLATFGYFRLSARLPANQPLDGSFEMEEGGHMEGVWGQHYPHLTLYLPQTRPEAEYVQARPGQD